MGEAKRKKQARMNGPYWAYFPPADHSPVTRLTLDEALNFGDYYTKQQAIEALPRKMPWEIGQMKINDKVYESVKALCLRKGYLNIGSIDAGEHIKWAPNLCQPGE